MQQHFTPIFAATPDGIMMDGAPLGEAAFNRLPQQTARYLERAEALLAQVQKADWDNRTPHDPNTVSVLVKAQMMLALASPRPFANLLEKAGFNSDEARDDVGRWAKDGVTADDMKNPRFKRMTPLEIKKQKFVDAHLATTEKAATQLNVPVANILGLSVLESGWGLGDFVQDGATPEQNTNSYFGMAAPLPFMNGTTQANKGKHLVASFANYEDSLKAFVATKGDAVRNISDPLAFATAAQIKAKFGIDIDTNEFDPTYIPKLKGTIEHLSDAIAFARKNPL